MFNIQRVSLVGKDHSAGVEYQNLRGKFLTVLNADVPFEISFDRPDSFMPAGPGFDYRGEFRTAFIRTLALRANGLGGDGGFMPQSANIVFAVSETDAAANYRAMSELAQGLPFQMIGAIGGSSGTTLEIKFPIPVGISYVNLSSVLRDTDSLAGTAVINSSFYDSESNYQNGFGISAGQDDLTGTYRYGGGSRNGASRSKLVFYMTQGDGTHVWDFAFDWVAVPPGATIGKFLLEFDDSVSLNRLANLPGGPGYGYCFVGAK